MPPRRALFIVNPKSRSGEDDLSAGVELLNDAGLDLLEPEVSDRHQLAAAIRAHRDEVDCVILGGGDGTLHAAAPALVENGLPLGILPTGTANDLARTLSIPTDLLAACAIIGQGVRHRIDLGCVNGSYFFNVASIGLGVRVRRHLTPELKQRWGPLSYGRSVLTAVRENRAFAARIRCNGDDLYARAVQIAVGNGRHYGGVMTVAEDATIDDQLLHLYVLEPRSLWQLLTLAPALRHGQHEDKEGVRLLRGREIEIKTRSPMQISADGEIVASTPARFHVVPGALEVYVPAAYFAKAEEMRRAAG